MRVPLVYASKDRMLARAFQEPNLDKETAISLPRMSFYLAGMNFDGRRHLNPIGKNVAFLAENLNKMKMQYNPVPYNFNFDLNIMTKTIEDGHMIVEQILPFFTPEWNATLNILPDMEYSLDVPVILKSCIPEDNVEGSMTDRRILTWKLQFEMKGYLFGPIMKKPIIKFSKTNYFMGNLTENEYGEKIQQTIVTPGLTPDGKPTSDPKESIDPNEISIHDDWGFAFEKMPGIVIDFE